MRMKNVMSCLIIVTLAIPAGGIAQGIPTSNWSPVGAVPMGEKLIVERSDGKKLKGSMGSVSESGLTLVRGQKLQYIERSEIKKIYRDGGKSKTKATLIGAGVGGASGAVIGAAAGGCDPNDWICFSRGETAAVTAVVGAAFGAITGFVVGIARHKKTLIYEVK
jgi:hypothetical protein